MFKSIPVLLITVIFCGNAQAQKYSFGPSPVSGYIQVKPNMDYTKDRGYGFDLGSNVEQIRDFTIGAKDRPFFFSSKLGPGAYQVKVTFGDPTAESVATVKSETRRLNLEAAKVPAGQNKEFTFLVHIRLPQLPDGREVRLKDREKLLDWLFVQWDKEGEVTFYELEWDEKLTLAFSDAHPALRSIEITPAEKPITVYLIGDSTVTDQMMEPWGAWGQQLPRFFKPPVLIANYAQSGETAASFIGELRWDKVMSEIHAGDYVFMQFGINDRGVADVQFKASFVKFIDDTRAKGATPVLVTSQNLRRLTEDGKGTNTLGTKPQVMRDVAKEKDAALIDLNEMSAKLYEAIGPTDLPKAFTDGTHQNAYGSYELAKCVTQGVIDNKLPISQYVMDGWVTYDPSHPMKLADFKLPADPQVDPYRPGGPWNTNTRPRPSGAALRGGRGATSGAMAETTSYKFDLSGKNISGQTPVAANLPYSNVPGYGYDSAPELKTADGSTLGDKPFFFSANVPEGNYKVTVTFGNEKAATDNVVNAELRRLMVEHVETKPGEFAMRSFIVNVRTPAIAGSDRKVRISGRESGQEIWAWDNRLTLEFNGAHPGISQVQIEKVEVPMIYVIGDSTVCDQDAEPYNSWGQMFTRFVKPVVAVSNHGESGESTAGALGKGRFDKIWAEMKKGDYLLMQFGHNDMKAPQPNAIDTFKSNLRKVVEETRARGGNMILFTPVSRRTFDADKKMITNSFIVNKRPDYPGDDYASAVKMIAEEMKVPLVDLQASSAKLYEALGDEASRKLFANAGENTHHSDYGSYEIAQCVVQLIKDGHPDLAKYIVDDFKGFDPSKPDPFESFKIPKSPRSMRLTPPGS